MGEQLACDCYLNRRDRSVLQLREPAGGLDWPSQSARDDRGVNRRPPRRSRVRRRSACEAPALAALEGRQTV